MTPPAALPGLDAPLTTHAVRLWLRGATRIITGAIDPSQARIYLFPLLFLNRLSNTLTEDPTGRIDLPNDCRWASLTSRPEGEHGHWLNRATRKLATLTEDLTGIFNGPDWENTDHLPAATLAELIAHLDLYQLSATAISDDQLGEAYEYLLDLFSDQSIGTEGQFFTPRVVADLLARLCDPQPGEAIYDPACGSGGLLLACAKHLNTAANLTSYCGQDLNPASLNIARLNFHTRHLTGRFALGDTLHDPQHLNPDTGDLTQFDLALANPPYGVKNWGANRWPTDRHRRHRFGGTPNSNVSDLAWLQHLLASVRPNTGRVAAIMPLGFLFRSGPDAIIRRWLVDTGTLHTLLLLPEGLFYGTPIPTCLAFARPSATGSVAPGDEPPTPPTLRLIDASRQFHKARRQNTLNPEDQNAIAEAFTDPTRTGPLIRQREVPLTEIEANDYTLTFNRYLADPIKAPPSIAEATANLSYAAANWLNAYDTLTTELAKYRPDR